MPVSGKTSPPVINLFHGPHGCSRASKSGPLQFTSHCRSTFCRPRIVASVQQDSREDLLDSMEDQFPLKRPRFQAFVGQTDKGRIVKAFRHTVRIEGGHLLIQPLGEEWLPQATDLLTESFADAVGYVPMYRGFLKKQVREYLASHINIAPKAIILEAVLIEEGSETEVPSPNVQSDNILRQTETSVSWIDKDAASSNDDNGASTASTEESDSPPNNPFQSSTAAILGETLMGSVENAGLPGSSSDAEEDGKANSVTSSGDSGTDSDSSSDGSSSEEDDPAPSLADSLESLENRSNGDAAEADVSWEAEAEALSQRFRNRDSTQQSSGAASNVETAVDDEPGDEVDRLPGQLIGTVELSFSASTRTKNLTLNPPEDGAYLCNMAVDEKHQRKGYGSLMLAAAEDLVEVADFRRVWLHVRLKDEPALGLYSKASYEIEKEDCILVGLWDDRRQLLSKFIPRRKGESATSGGEAADQQKQQFIPEYWQ